MRLFNFYHGLDAPKVLNFGEFEVIVDQQHCANLGKLARCASTEFGFDVDFNRDVTSSPAVRGEIVETGVLRFSSGQPGQSKLLPKVTGLTVAFDALLILSFLTGRRVYHEHELEGDLSRRSLDGAVCRTFFFTWQGGELSPTRLRQTGLASAIYNVVNAYTAHELIGMAAYANFALEAASVQWAKESHATTFESSSMIAHCRDDVAAWLENRLRTSLLHMATTRMVNLLLGEKIEERVIDDIRKRLEANSSQPSAQHRMENFLSAMGIVSSPPTDDEMGRIKKLNRLRNAVAHKGDIDRRGAASEELAAGIALGATLMTLEIAQYYIATRGLGLALPELERSRNKLKAFFSTGIYHGQDMFGETYNEFIKRAEEDWLEEGLINPRRVKQRAPNQGKRGNKR